MSLLGHYSVKRNSSLSLFSPVDSPVRRIFKPSNSINLYRKLDPLKLDPNDAAADDKGAAEESDKGKDDKGKDDKGKDKKGKDKKGKDEKEPICDLELLPGFAANTKKVHSKIELAALPPLGAPGSSGFTTALQKKVNLICTELDFMDPEGDVEAKEVRLNTLNELLGIVQNSFERLSNDDQDIIYDGIKKILFKDLSPILPQYLFCDDLVTLIDGAWEQTKIAYQILAAFALSAQPHPELMKLIFRQFGKFDMNERNQLLDLVNQMIEKDASIVPEVLKKCCHVIANYLDGGTLPYVLLPTVSIITNIFKKATDVTQYEQTYVKYILPLLGAKHFPICAENIILIIEQFVKGNQGLVMPTITELVRHFPRTRSVKTITFLKMLTTSMTKMNTRDFRKNMKILFHLFVKCTVGPQIKVSDASLGVWHKIELEPLIMDNAKVIFPFVYPILSKGMRENWSQDIINNIDDIFQTMNRIDSFIFQELCRQKVPNQQQQGAQSNDHLKTWATIARGAAKTDKELNLATKLAEIQRVFAIQQLQPITPTNNQKNRSATNLSNIQAPQITKPTNRSNVSLTKNSPLPPFKPP